MKGKIARNTIILSFSRFGSRFLVFLFGIYLARILGATDFGKFIFATSFIFSFAPLADFGMENFLLREVSRRSGERVKILGDLLYPRIAFAFLAYALMIIVAYLAGYENEDLANIAFYGLSLLPYSINYFFLAYFNAQEKVIKSSLLKIFYPSLYIFFGWLFLRLGWGYRGVILASLLANSAPVLFLLSFYHQILVKPRFIWAKVREVIRQTWPFAVLVFIAVVYLRIDLMILKRIEGNEAVGLYGPASTLMDTAVLIPQSFALALFPLSSRLVKNNRMKMKGVYLKGLAVLFLSALPLFLIGFFLTPILVPLLFGSEYLRSILAVQIAFLSLVLFFINALPGNVILNSKKVKGFIPLALSNLGVNVLLNFLLIPSLSFVGSAWAKIGSEVFGLIVNNLYVYKILSEKT